MGTGMASCRGVLALLSVLVVAGSGANEMHKCPSDHNERIIIVEGVPGAGKDTLIRQLLANYTRAGIERVYPFGEEEMLFSWRHTWIKDIRDLRLELWNRTLDWFESEIRKDEQVRFVVNRFHISFHLYTWGVKSPAQ